MSEMTNDDELRMVPLCKAAKMVGVSERTMQRIVHTGALKTIRTSQKSNGGRWVSISTLRKFVNDGGVPSAVTPINC